eukprot:TRINITY_DN36567_c0_g1_i1.p1 TRINITY_DN36567_c0_g1~~TRINITY_DN36567_c0_g1_i1.p1  ORF type:complete len:478 (+),score=71.48 TRINITY_DN36567_c0_g1_i1:224-1657(+)
MRQRFIAPTSGAMAAQVRQAKTLPEQAAMAAAAASPYTAASQSSAAAAQEVVPPHLKKPRLQACAGSAPDCSGATTCTPSFGTASTSAPPTSGLAEASQRLESAKWPAADISSWQVQQGTNCGHAQRADFAPVVARRHIPKRSLVAGARPPDATVPSNKQQTLEAALQRLQGLISEAPKERRRELLGDVPLQVQSILIAYMQASRGKGCAKPAQDVSQAPNRQKTAGQRGRASLTRQRALRSQPPVGGVSMKKGGYLARANLAPYLAVTSSCYKTRCKAERVCTVLRRAGCLIRGALPVSTQPDAILRHGIVVGALAQACHEESLELSTLGLSYCARVTIHQQETGTLVVGGSFSDDLDMVLAQRARLVAARQEGCDRLRAEWVDVLQMKRRVFGRACSAGDSRAKAESRAAAIWSRHVEKIAKRSAKQMEKNICMLNRRIQRAAAVVTRLLPQCRKGHSMLPKPILRPPAGSTAGP